MREKLAKWLDPRSYELLDAYKNGININPKELAREEFQSIDVKSYVDTESGKDYVFEMKKDERETFLADAHLVFQNQSFQKVINKLLNDQACKSVIEAETLRQLDCGRFTINGISLILGEFERLDCIYRASIQEKREERSG